MRKFDDDFKSALRTAVEATEAVSGVELVVTILPRASRYWDTFLAAGLLTSFLVLTVMMFIPTEFWYVLIYLETLGAFLLTLGILWAFPGLVRLLNRKKMHALVETATRALFQKAGMVETSDRIGVLVLFAWYERTVIMLPDTGAEELLPPDELAQLTARFQTIFTDRDPAQAILDRLEEARSLFELYIPRDVHDINELPDELWLH